MGLLPAPPRPAHDDDDDALASVHIGRPGASARVGGVARWGDAVRRGRRGLSGVEVKSIPLLPASSLRAPRTPHSARAAAGPGRRPRSEGSR